MIPDFLRRLLARSGPDSVLVACAGFDPISTVSADLNRHAACRLVDLDKIGAEPELAELRIGSVVVLARTPTDVRRAATLSRMLPKTRHVLIIASYAPPDRSPPVPAPHPRWRTLEELRVRRLRTGGWAVETQSSTSRPAGEVLAATAKALGGHPLNAGPGRTAGLAGVGAVHWRPGDPNALLVEPDRVVTEPNRNPPVDLVLRTTVGEPVAWPDPLVPVVDRPAAPELSWRRLGEPGIDAARTLLPALTDPDIVPPVDERSVNPIGFVVAPTLGFAVLAQEGTAWEVRLGELVLGRFSGSGPVTDVDVAQLREVRAVRVEWGRHSGPIAAVHVVAGLAAAGVPLFATRIPAWAHCLGDELIRLLVGTDESALADDLVREEHSILLRRAALRIHGTRARWTRLFRQAGVPEPPPASVSVVLCTRRPEMLAFAFGQIGRQRLVDFEVVLTLHGVDAGAPEVTAAIADFGRPVSVVEVPETVPFGMALNRGAARASGRFLAKMDDDDWYGPEHLADLLLARHYSGGDLVGCHNEFTYLEQIGLTVRLRADTERPHQQVAGGTLMIERSVFEELGGFRPLPGSEDTHLQRAIDAAGGKIYRTHGLGYVLRRKSSGHTWTESIGYFLRRSIRQWRGFRPSALLEAADLPASALPAAGLSISEPISGSVTRTR
ncbi:glycosyltransferase [Actinomadura alba]|uniref:Glycosyltransferase family 2 protein n=1 Tax=Actinomadura alba TaxID=406431 RepID=A0ABR7LJ66_9ACTN|nr:glycosyltransferase family A protein [Actinomadura alba]MBC6464799.1 glycosyltransferase family 2 protein [Actinomadura alba]